MNESRFTLLPTQVTKTIAAFLNEKLNDRQKAELRALIGAGTGDGGEPLTGEQIAELLDTALGSADWRGGETTMTGEQIAELLDTALDSADWRGGETTMTGEQIASTLDTYFESTQWRENPLQEAPSGSSFYVRNSGSWEPLGEVSLYYYYGTQDLFLLRVIPQSWDVAVNSSDEFTVVIPENVLLSESSFSPSFVNSITIAGYTTFIPQYFASNCSLLASLVCNTGSIDAFAFAGCYSLTNAQFGNPTSINAYAFNGCSNLSIVQFGNQLAVIGEAAFQSTSIDLANSPLPETVVTIGDVAFNASQTTSLTLPASVESIGAYAFGSCPIGYVACYRLTPPSTPGGSIFDFLAGMTATEIHVLPDADVDSWGTTWADLDVVYDLGL